MNMKSDFYEILKEIGVDVDETYEGIRVKLTL